MLCIQEVFLVCQNTLKNQLRRNKKEIGIFNEIFKHLSNAAHTLSQHQVSAKYILKTN